MGNIHGPGKRTEHFIPGAWLSGQSLLSLTGDKMRTDEEKLEILAREFESIFINQMLKTMRSTIDKSGLIDGGSAEELFIGMQDEELARQMAFSQNSGLSAALVEQLSGMLSKEKEPAPEKNE